MTILSQKSPPFIPIPISHSCFFQGGRVRAKSTHPPSFDMPKPPIRPAYRARFFPTAREGILGLADLSKLFSAPGGERKKSRGPERIEQMLGGFWGGMCVYRGQQTIMVSPPHAGEEYQPSLPDGSLSRLWDLCEALVFRFFVLGQPPPPGGKGCGMGERWGRGLVFSCWESRLRELREGREGGWVW